MKINNQSNQEQNNKSRVEEIAIVLIICSLIVSVTYFSANYLVIDEQNSDVLTKEQKLSEIKRSNDLLEQIAANRLELDKQTNELDEAYKTLAPLIPEKKELPLILDRIQRSAIDRGLRLDNFTANSEVKKQGALSEIPITIELTGDPEQLRLYVSSLNYLERILHVNALKTSKIQDGQYAGNIKAELQLSAYISNIQNNELSKPK